MLVVETVVSWGVTTDESESAKVLFVTLNVKILLKAWRQSACCPTATGCAGAHWDSESNTGTTSETMLQPVCCLALLFASSALATSPHIMLIVADDLVSEFLLPTVSHCTERSASQHSDSRSVRPEIPPLSLWKPGIYYSVHQMKFHKKRKGSWCYTFVSVITKPLRMKKTKLVFGRTGH